MIRRLGGRQQHHGVVTSLLLLLSFVSSGCQGFFLPAGGAAAGTSTSSGNTNPAPTTRVAPAQAVAIPAPVGKTIIPQQQQQQQQTQAQTQAQALAAKKQKKQMNRLDLRSPFISVEIKPATRLEEFLSVIDLRTEVFAGSSVLTVEGKLRHIKHLLTRRAKGSMVVVATARDLLSPFSEEVVIGSIELSMHEFEEGNSPFLHDNPMTRKLYLTEMAVKEPFRRQGVATSLLKAVDGVAAKVGASYVCLFCELSNKGAVNLYDSLGFHGVSYSPTIETFAERLGLLKSNKAHGFFYKQLQPAVTAAVAPIRNTNTHEEKVERVPVPTVPSRAEEEAAAAATTTTKTKSMAIPLEAARAAVLPGQASWVSRLFI